MVSMNAPLAQPNAASSPHLNRRAFVKTAATFASLTALSANRVVGANERIRVGLNRLRASSDESIREAC
jgi:hypothetical protein